MLLASRVRVLNAYRRILASVVAEGGYQQVTEWSSLIDASSVRAYAGLSRSF